MFSINPLNFITNAPSDDKRLQLEYILFFNGSHQIFLLIHNYHFLFLEFAFNQHAIAKKYENKYYYFFASIHPIITFLLFMKPSN